MSLLWCFLCFGQGPLDLTSGTLDWVDDSASQSVNGVGVALVRPDIADTVVAEFKAQVQILGVLGEGIYLVDWGQGLLRKSAYAAAVERAMVLPAHLKLSPAMGRADRDQLVTIQLVPRLDPEVWSRDWLGVKASQVARLTQFSLVRLELAQIEDRLADILAHPGVIWVEPYAPKRLFNDRSVWVCQSGLDGGQATPVHDQGLRGQGQTVAVMDTGLDADHCDFYDSVEGLPTGTLNLNQRKVVAYLDLGAEGNWDSQGHGTHVAGSVAGDNAPYGVHAGNDGMAPAARLVIQDGGYAVDPFADLPFLPADYYNDLFQPAYDLGARIHTNSWGAHEDFGTNNYTVECQMTDQFMWDHPNFLVFFAAGNAGHSGGPTVSDPATAKNVVAVGATSGGTGADNMASFSSSGPVQDGRMKPEIVTPGAGIHSAGNSSTFGNCSSATLSGTSMACPTAAGLAALVRQYYQDGFYPSGMSKQGGGFEPSAALIKATLIASGRPLGSLATYPSNVQGFGRVTLDDVLYFDQDRETLWLNEHVGLSTGQQFTHNFDVEEGEEVRVVLVWTDYPSVPMAAKDLINDLNLSVQGPTDLFLGNVWSAGFSVPGGSADDVNIVETVRIGNAPAGNYSLTVDALSVPQGPQPFALVVLRSPVPSQMVVLDLDDIDASSGQDLFYQVEVPPEAIALHVETSGGTGDADLYVRFDVAPTTSVFDASSTGPSSTESVVVGDPNSGTWHILLHAWSAFSGVDLLVYYDYWPTECLLIGQQWSTWPVAVQILDLVATINSCP